MFEVGASVTLDGTKINKVAALGVRYVELALIPLGGGGSIPAEIKSTNEAMRDHGVRAFSCHAPTGAAFDIGNSVSEKRLSAVEEHKKHIEYCAKFGSKNYVIHPGFEDHVFGRGGGWDDVKKVALFPRDDQGALDRLWDANVASLASVADYADGLGVRVCLETGPPNMTTPDEIMSMVRRVGKKNLGVCVDVGHVNVGGAYDPAQVIREFGSIVWTLHLHDNHADGDFHLIPGRGTIDWKEVLEALRDISFGGVLNIEMGGDVDEATVWDDLREGVSFLRRIQGLQPSLGSVRSSSSKRPRHHKR